MEQDIGTYAEFLDALGQRESSDDYQLINNGFLGRYQISELVLVYGSTIPELDYYNLDDDPGDNDYNGTWTGLDGVESLDDFLNNEEAQDNLIRAWFDNLLEIFDSEGILHYAGQVFDNIEISLTGMLAGAHLVGYPALIEWLESDKSSAPEDANGTSLTEYLDLFSPYATEEEVAIDRSGAATYNGSPGADTLFGGGGNDTLNGHGGTDTALYEGDGPGYLITRNENGTYTVRDTDTPSEEDEEGVDEGTDTLVNMERVTFDDQTLVLSEIEFAPDGTFRPRENPDDDRPDFDDRFVGTEGDDNHFGGATTNDNMAGRGGDDTLSGQGGDDAAFGGEGNDILGGGVGDDTLRGADGNDRLWGGEGNDLQNGDAGNDLVVGAAGDDTVLGAAGDDRLFGKAGNDRVDGGAGRDKIRGNDGDDTLIGGEGNDAIRGGAGNDVITGGEGNDHMLGEAGADRFAFGEGFGRDVIHDFEVGVDKLDFSQIENGNTLFRVAQIGEFATVIFESGDRVRLVDVTQDELGNGDFIF